MPDIDPVAVMIGHEYHRTGCYGREGNEPSEAEPRCLPYRLAAELAEANRKLAEIGALVRAQDMVREFHETFGLPVRDTPTLPSLVELMLRWRLIAEESNEVRLAMRSEDLADTAQELADLAYVVYGTAIAYGVDLDAVIAEVHRANMSKLGADGKPLMRPDGKVLKGPRYSPPDIGKVLFGGAA